MDWAQVWTIVGVNIALIATMITIIGWIASKHDGDIQRIETRLDGHAARIDQLYQLCCDMLKERK